VEWLQRNEENKEISCALLTECAGYGRIHGVCYPLHLLRDQLRSQRIITISTDNVERMKLLQKEAASPSLLASTETRTPPLPTTITATTKRRKLPPLLTRGNNKGETKEEEEVVVISTSSLQKQATEDEPSSLPSPNKKHKPNHF
jgi:hypothetical protein